ncbi:hypothetical protein AMELA_G00059470 [Ameiurus melas]|uniref:L1 transposable element RRM domain-containing protein n=1 Tax=Ameiurus melas TaxID=219545 RepID=A0A7J6B3A0_AMEME|nr:hypothetical protein AMELA_G00059470 [Ameiurus melas]
MAKKLKSSSSGHLRVQDESPDGPVDHGLILGGAAREEIQRQLSSMSGMLAKVVADFGRSRCNTTFGYRDRNKILQFSRVADAEKRIECLESSERALSANPFATDLEKIFERLEDLENRSRRNNLRIIGVPEHEEGRDMVKFLDELFLSLLDITGHKLELEWAHRVPARRSGEEYRPQPILARFLRSSDKDLVLRQASSKGRLSWKNHNIFLFPDFANSTREKRDRFKECKKVLHQHDEIAELKETIDPMQHSESFGVDLYRSTVQILISAQVKEAGAETRFYSERIERTSLFLLGRSSVRIQNSGFLVEDGALFSTSGTYR